ncbi:MAG: hypothetical protein O3B65_02720 [Chloroflexi bacterium]|nr:hypothetical protein [Chloroflexota bacterium]
MATRVLIVENEGLFRDMLRVALESRDEFEVAGAVGDGRSAVLQRVLSTWADETPWAEQPSIPQGEGRS